MLRIKTYDNVAVQGLELLDSSLYQVGPEVENPDGIIVRSSSLHEVAIDDSLRVVARAGAGVNNVPVTQLSESGVVVLNTPGANANAVKELVLTGMLLACRNICSAWDYVKQLSGDQAEMNKQVEGQKKQFVGCELPGRTLGVIGLGAIGVSVANAAVALGMEVIGYDPCMSIDNAWKLNASVVQATSEKDVIARSDFISLHVPLNSHTESMVNESFLSSAKDGLVLLNFSRGGVIDSAAIKSALEQGKLGQYVSDFPDKALVKQPGVISLPHLGASTQEAQVNCAVMAVRQMIDFLEHGHIHNSVNFPSVKLSGGNVNRLAVINRNVPSMLASISTALSDFSLNIMDMVNKSRDELAYTLVDVDSAISPAVLEAVNKIDGVVKTRVVR